MIVMDKDKFINTNLYPTRNNHIDVVKDKSNYRTIYIFKFNKEMEVIKYKANVILGKVPTIENGKIFIVHSTRDSDNIKEGINYYERTMCNKVFNTTEDSLRKHPYEYTIRIDCRSITENKSCYNYTVPIFEGEIYSNTVWYMDENHSLKEFENTVLEKIEKSIKDTQRRLNESVEKYNKLSIFYDSIGGEENESNGN